MASEYTGVNSVQIWQQLRSFTFLAGKISATLNNGVGSAQEIGTDFGASNIAKEGRVQALLISNPPTSTHNVRIFVAAHNGAPPASENETDIELVPGEHVFLPLSGSMKVWLWGTGINAKVNVKAFV